MILVDSSIWIDHLRRLDAKLSALLAARVVMCHPFVVGELACGNLSKRDVLFSLDGLPSDRTRPHRISRIISNWFFFQRKSETTSESILVSGVGLGLSSDIDRRMDGDRAVPRILPSMLIQGP